MPKIELKTEIAAKKGIVFDLSRSIDLHKISAKDSKETAVGGVTFGLIGFDEHVTWRAKHFGIYQNLTSKITQFNYPNSFTDEMVKGAFKEFKHQHIFEQKDHKTVMMDVFEYKSPFGILGKVADFLFLKKYLVNFLKERNRIIKDYAETNKWKELLYM